MRSITSHVNINQPRRLNPLPSVSTLLLTGHTGFVGRAIKDSLGAQSQSRWAIATFDDHQDVRDAQLPERIEAIRPDVVIHLAARTSVAESFRDPEGYFDVNFNGTLNLLRALHATKFRGRFLYIGSGDCYGAIEPAELPVRENHPLRPRNPYAVSKVAAEALCYQWSQTERLDAVIARPFNHIGRGQDERFVVAAFAKQIAAIRLGRAPPQVTCGNLEVTRDLTDVRDVIDAYVALIEHGRTGEAYNVGSGREVRIRDVLARLLELAGVDAEIQIDSTRIRADEQLRVCADVSRIHADTGWASRITLDGALREILDYWMIRETQ
jgi:GDP-4-dehydro-6-deoxy-D-mannose reductase